MFLKNYWYAAANSAELTTKPIARTLLGLPVALFRTASGTPVAFLDACPHRSYPLSQGRVEGENLRCCYHGLIFAPDGICLHIPGQKQIPPKAKASNFLTVEKWNWIWIWMGEDDAATEESIPDMHWNDDKDWAPTGGHLEIGCDYKLLIDNLLDLSHAAYVHASTIGDVSVAETPPKVWSDEEKVVLERYVYNVDPPPFFSSLHGYNGKINRMHTIEFRPPSNIVILARCVPEDEDLVSSPNGLEYRVLNAITPADNKRTHHFWAVNRNFRTGDAELTKGFQKQSEETFIEDIAVLESQQDRINQLAQGAAWFDVKNDSAGVLARRMLSKLDGSRSYLT